MLRAQHEIALREPIGRPTVQLAPPRAQQRIVDGIPDQGVGEAEARPLVWPQQQPLHELGRLIAGQIEDMGESVALEALSEDGSGLQGGLVERV